MKTKAEELDRIFLWLLLTGGLLSLLIYGLASFIAQPSAETITTHAPAQNANEPTEDIKFHPHKSK